MSRSQKEAIGLLQIGTFLEYFDLMLYVHMAVLLNELFFPKYDPHTSALVAAFAFCSTYVMRPFGALLFGYIGDNIGRKATVVLTTMMMFLSCVAMANLPTYSQIGITASVLVTVCRITQGLSSMGEIMGARIYVTEMIKPPAQYAAVSFLSTASGLGTAMALGVATLVTRFNCNWRIAFWVGSGIAVTGTIARMRLRETPDFIEARSKKTQMKTNQPKEKISQKTILAFFFVHSGWPLAFYLAFMYFNPLLERLFGYETQDIILHNFFLSLVSLAAITLYSYLSFYFHPLKITHTIAILSGFLMLVLPWLINSCGYAYQIFIIQSLILFLCLGSDPSGAIFIKNIPVLNRFKVSAIVHAISRALVYACVPFSLVYFTEWFGHYGIWVIAFPITACFFWGIDHYEKLEGLRPANASSWFKKAA